MNPLIVFIDPHKYDRAEDYADIESGTLQRLFPTGGYTNNIVRLLPGGEQGEQAKSLLAWVSLEHARPHQNLN